uniref:Uncharacterized protein n=1 Tax=Candidozyma auris TaxID=498019 RepID=A0A0L0P610_CANAR
MSLLCSQGLRQSAYSRTCFIDGDTPYHQRELTIPFYLTHEKDYSIWIYKLIKEISKVVGYNNRHFFVKNLKNEELALEFIKDLSEEPQNLLNNMKGMAIEVVIKVSTQTFAGVLVTCWTFSDIPL